MKVHLLSSTSENSQEHEQDFISLNGFKNATFEPETFEELVTNLKYEKIPLSSAVSAELAENDCMWDQIDDIEQLIPAENE